jgi:phosphoglycolate phosphatase
VNAPYALAVFDFDGTLADTLPWLLGVLDGLADRFGFTKLDGDELEAVRRLGTRAILKRMGLPLWKVPAVVKHVRTLAARDVRTLPIVAGTREALRTLDEHGVVLAVVSSNSEDNVRVVLGDDAARIRFYECGASILGKARLLRKVLAKARVAPGDAIYVGDELRDGEAAASVGMRFGAVSWGFQPADVLRQKSPAAIFDDMDDLRAKLTGRR